MKLDPVFEVKENQLFTMQGEKVSAVFKDVTDIEKVAVESGSFYKIIVEQKTIEPEEECYNEEYLARLRDYLKLMEEKNAFAALYVIPAKASEGADSPETENYCACVKHATRRVKDCTNLAGVWLCDEYAKNGDAAKVSVLIDELIGKHAQYVYFAGSEVLSKAKTLDESYSGKIAAF